MDDAMKRFAKKMLASSQGQLPQVDINVDKDKLIDQLLTYQAELQIQNEELINTQKSLVIEKSKFERLFSDAPVPFICIDSKAVITRGNDSFSNMLRYSKNIEGKPLVVFIETSSHTIFFDKFNTVKKKQSEETFNMVLRHHNETEVWVVCSLKPFELGEDNQIYLATFTDITDLMLLEEELRIKNANLQDVNSRLEHRVAEETQKRIRNEHMMFEQQKFADMGQMINAIAHQWRQPLNALSLMIQMLPSEDVKESVPEMLNIVLHLSKTIDDFRNFFKPSKDDELFNVVECLLESYSLFKAKIIEKNIEFRFKCKCNEHEFVMEDAEHEPKCISDGHVYGSKSKLKQVVLNLIQNALDAAEEVSPNGTVSLSLSIENLHASITIEDNGGGIHPDIIPKIFDPYFTTKDEGKGTGIGLYMSRTIIEEYFKGTISVMNTNSGARFITNFPLAHATFK